MSELGRLKIEVRPVPDGILVQVNDRFYVVLTDAAAVELADLLYETAAMSPNEENKT